MVQAASAPWSQAKTGCCALQDMCRTCAGHVCSFPAHHQPIEGKEKDSESEEEQEDGEDGDGDKDEKDETKKGSTETFSFGRMCAFSNEVMGQKTEGWMEISNLPYSKLCVVFFVFSYFLDVAKQMHSYDLLVLRFALYRSRWNCCQCFIFSWT